MWKLITTHYVISWMTGLLFIILLTELFIKLIPAPSIEDLLTPEDRVFLEGEKVDEDSIDWDLV